MDVRAFVLLTRTANYSSQLAEIRQQKARCGAKVAYLTGVECDCLGDEIQVFFRWTAGSARAEELAHRNGPANRRQPRPMEGATRATHLQ